MGLGPSQSCATTLSDKTGAVLPRGGTEGVAMGTGIGVANGALPLAQGATTVAVVDVHHLWITCSSRTSPSTTSENRVNAQK